MAEYTLRYRSHFAAAMAAARTYLGHDREACARILRVSRRTILRWEQGTSCPDPLNVPSVVAWARTIPAPYGQAIVDALDPARAAGGRSDPATAPSTPSDDAALASVERAVSEVAEALDVGPRTVRQALGEFLARLDAAGVSIPRARAAMARKNE